MSSDAPFQVIWSSKALQQLRELARNQNSAITRPKLAAILPLLDEQLRHDPLAIGEIYRKRGTIVVHRCIRGRLMVDFAIDPQRRLVYVRACQVLDGP